MTTTFKYDVVLSFAGEDRRHADILAKELKALGLVVFYDEDERADLWGKDLYQYFQSVYRDQARYCVILISRHYVAKRWTRHELQQAQARVFRSSDDEYILPLRLDDTEVPGLNETVAFLDLRHIEVASVARFVLQKLERTGRTTGVPSPPPSAAAGVIRRPWWRRRLGLSIFVGLLGVMSLGATLAWDSIFQRVPEVALKQDPPGPAQREQTQTPRPPASSTTGTAVGTRETAPVDRGSRSDAALRFENPGIVSNVLAGRLDAVTYDERYAKMYLAHMARQMSKSCPGLFSHRDIDALTSEANADIIDLSSPKDKEVRYYKIFVLKKPGETTPVRSSMAGDVAALPEDAGTDAASLVARHGCNSPVLSNFERHLRAYLNAPRLSAGDLVTACQKASASGRRRQIPCRTACVSVSSRH